MKGKYKSNDVTCNECDAYIGYVVHNRKKNSDKHTCLKCVKKQIKEHWGKDGDDMVYIFNNGKGLKYPYAIEDI